MADFAVKYSGTPANDSGLTSEVIANTGSASGQDHSMQNTIQKRVGVTCVCDANVLNVVDILVIPKIGANYGKNVNAMHRLVLDTVANDTVYQEFILLAANTPKDFRFTVVNNSLGSITITVETEDAVVSDTP